MIAKTAGSLGILLIGLFLSCLLLSPAAAQDNETCLMCHEDPDMVGEKDGREYSVFVDPDVFAHSVHGEVECIQCHYYLDGVEDFPHEEAEPEPVECGICHDDISEQYMESLHGQKLEEGEELAPACWDCHGAHDVRPHSDPKSPVAKFNIPFMCGACHKEGAPVDRKYDIPQDSILSHYSLSIHGEGLYKQGLTVSAVCSDCHTAHHVLPHGDPRSSIHRDNVSLTCQKCHGRIEEVHTKVIRGELWEKEPNKVPVCVDCHEPHKARKVFYQEVSDRECMACHADRNLTMVRDGVTLSLYVDTVQLKNSIHRGQTCAQCHTNTSPHMKRPCATVPDKVDCGVCHTETVELYATSTHGMLNERGDQDAPECTDCHGRHDTRGHKDPKSRTYARNVPDLCTDCHSPTGAVGRRHARDGVDHHVGSYPMSIHGKGLLESGLLVTAMCTDCHTAHHVLPETDPLSSVHHDNIARTCATCHDGIYEQFVTSIHSPAVSESKEALPTCASCHHSHTIERTDSPDFKQEMIDQCGDCHA